MVDLESRLNKLETLIESKSKFYDDKIQKLESYNSEMEKILANIINTNLLATIPIDKNNQSNYHSILDFYLLKVDHLNDINEKVIYYIFNYDNFKTYDKNDYQKLLSKKILINPNTVKKLDFEVLLMSFTVETFEYFCELFTSVYDPEFDANKFLNFIINTKKYNSNTNIFKYFLTKFHKNIDIKGVLTEIINKSDKVEHTNSFHYIHVDQSCPYKCSTKYDYCNAIIDLIISKPEYNNIKIGIGEFNELNNCYNACERSLDQSFNSLNGYFRVYVGPSICCNKIRALINFFNNNLCDDEIMSTLKDKNKYYFFLRNIIKHNNIECFRLALDKFSQDVFLDSDRYKFVFELTCEYNRIEFAKVLVKYIPNIKYKKIKLNEYKKMDSEFIQWIQDGCPVNKKSIKSARSIQ